MHRKLGLAGAIALGLIALAAPARAQTPAPAPAAAQPQADYYCPDCHAPIRWNQDKCPSCGAEFEPLKPRVKKGEGAPPPAAAPGPEAPGSRNESPFPAPPPDQPNPPGAPQIIDSPWPQIQPPSESRFGFGSYGRVGITVAPDLHGAKPFDIVDFRPRLDEGPYQELSFYYKDTLAAMPILVKTTLAFQENLFHYTGEFDAQFALRELYAELNPTPSVAVWIGSRMYRGDDIYIFDFWPLDNQNTLGGGAAFKLTEDQTLQAHVGFNRIVDHNVFYQFQTIDVPAFNSVGSQQEVFLDRNRGVVSLTYKIMLPWGLKWKVHGEGHYLPSGDKRLDNGQNQHLPADRGFLIGTEVEERFDPSFVRLFVKYARGLAAYDPLSVPFGFAPDLTITDSERVLVGVGGAIDTHWFGMHYGAFWQHFTDSSGIDNFNDQDQYAIAARPEVYLGDYVRAGFEVSWEGQQPKGIFPETGREEFAQVTSFTFLLGLATGRGPYARPALYAFYGFHWLNGPARIELARTLVDEPHAREDVFGLLAEWWF
jgi:maltoporin